MKITISKKSLSDGLALIERIIPNKSSNPLLTSLKIDASDKGLTLSGTNLEIDLSCFVPAEVSDAQSLVIPAHLFSQIVRNLGGELIELELSGNELAVHAGGSDFKLQVGDLEAYPPLSFPEHADVSLDAAEFAKALASVRYAASNEAFQAVFRGIKLEHHEQSARVVASDGYRVAIRDFPASGEGKDLIIPARSADELIRVLKEGEARLTYAMGILSVTTDRLHMNLKLLDGDFPDYERVIPKDIKVSISLAANMLKEAISRVAVLADKNSNHRVEFMVSDGTLRLSTEGDYGRAQDTLEVTQEGPEPAMSLSFNAKYLSDALSPLSGEVEMLLSGPTSPAIIREHGGGSYRAIVVALKV